jgi:hypothetical protein
VEVQVVEIQLVEQVDQVVVDLQELQEHVIPVVAEAQL